MERSLSRRTFCGCSRNRKSARDGTSKIREITLEKTVRACNQNCRKRIYNFAAPEQGADDRGRHAQERSGSVCFLLYRRRPTETDRNPAEESGFCQNFA